MDTHILNIFNRKQLFLDEYFVDQRHNAEFALNKPRKTNERTLVADCPWEDWEIGAWSTVLEDQGKYKMWYEAYTKNPDEPRTSLCYAESEDGVKWTKPELGLIPFGGSKKNNIVFPSPEFNSIHGSTVFVDPSAPANERYKLFFLSHQPIPECIYGATSPDGLHWKRNPLSPLVRTQPDTQNVAFWDDRLNKYVAYVRLCRPLRDPNRLRVIGRTETTDFTSWPTADLVHAFDELDDDDVDLYNNAAFKYAHADNAYFILTSVYHQRRDQLDIQLAISRDGVRWNRPFRVPFIGLGEPGSFDSECIYASVGRIRKGDELWLYYYGTNRSHDSGVKDAMHYSGVISRAVLRLDGFISLHAGETEGSVMTKPLIFTGSRLELNAVTRSAGHVGIELCDIHGKPLPGFDRQNVKRWTGDSVQGRIDWVGGAELNKWSGKPVRLKFNLRLADIYAFQFVD